MANCLTQPWDSTCQIGKDKQLQRKSQAPVKGWFTPRFPIKNRSHQRLSREFLDRQVIEVASSTDEETPPPRRVPKPSAHKRTSRGGGWRAVTASGNMEWVPVIDKENMHPRKRSETPPSTGSKGGKYRGGSSSRHVLAGRSSRGVLDTHSPLREIINGGDIG